MASVRGMTPEAILALIKRELANVKLSEDQIRDLIQSNTDIVDSIVDLEDKVQAGLTGEALDQLNLDLQQLRSDLQAQAAALAAADTKLQENSQTLIDNQEEMALLSVLLSDEGFLNTETIKPGTLLGEHLAARTVSALNIAAGAIVSEKIAADAITANHILAESITGDRLVARTVGADRLIADSITANEISSGAITTNELAVGAVSAENISAEGISADLITAGSLSATRVELAGNDLATQMDFILSQLDENFSGLKARFDVLESYVEDRFSRPVFLSTYGILDLPNNAFDPFMRWVNLSQETYSPSGELATLGFRVETNEFMGEKTWELYFPESFEGRIQFYKDGIFLRETFHDQGTPHPYPLRSDFDRMVWFAEVRVPHAYRWYQRFNSGGDRVRNPPTGYGYLSPHKVTFNSGVTDTDINNTFRNSSATSIVRNTSTHKGTPGGVSDLVVYSTDGTTTRAEYTSDPADPTTWFPMQLHCAIESAARRISITARMRISQPKRSDRYGLLIYKNDRYEGFETGTGVGTLNGSSILFSHEDVHLSRAMEILLYPGDTVTLVPVIMVVGSRPLVAAQVMEIDWTLFTT